MAGALQIARCLCGILCMSLAASPSPLRPPTMVPSKYVKSSIWYRCGIKKLHKKVILSRRRLTCIKYLVILGTPCFQPAFTETFLWARLQVISKRFLSSRRVRRKGTVHTDNSRMTSLKRIVSDRRIPSLFPTTHLSTI